MTAQELIEFCVQNPDVPVFTEGSATGGLVLQTSSVDRIDLELSGSSYLDSDMLGALMTDLPNATVNIYRGTRSYTPVSMRVQEVITNEQVGVDPVTGEPTYQEVSRLQIVIKIQ